MSDRVTDVILSSGVPIHVYGTAEELRTKIEALVDSNARTPFLAVDVQGLDGKRRTVTINILHIAMITGDHPAGGHGAEARDADQSHASL